MLVCVLEIGLDGVLRPHFCRYRTGGVVRVGKSAYIVEKKSFVPGRWLGGFFVFPTVLVSQNAIHGYVWNDTDGRLDVVEYTADEFGQLLDNTALACGELLKSEGDKLAGLNTILLVAVVAILIFTFF